MDDYDVSAAFEEMELELIASMKRNLSRHQKWEKNEGMNWSMWQVEQLKTLEQFKKNNQKIFSKKFSNINNEIAKFLKANYKTSGFEQEKAILKELAKGNIFNPKTEKGLNQSFFSLNTDKMNALIKATTNDMKKAETAMLRMVNDQYRKTIFNAQVMANSGAFTLKQSIDKATRDFLKAGINCIQYKDGRRVNIASYAEMAIRTANKRAKLISEGDARNALGVHTVKVSKYGQCSETCLPWQGRVYVDDVYSGGTKEEAQRLNLPLLSEAIAGGLFHPNCKHTMTTYFYDLKRSLGKLQEDGAENPPEEQEHRKNLKHIQQQKRLEIGSLDQANIEQAKERKEQWIKKDEKISTVSQDKNTVVDGTNMIGKTQRRKELYPFEIEDVINQQGFDGFPKELEYNEFEKAMQKSNFYAERTYSAIDKETLEGYKKQLRSGKWYIDCSTGGSQYGRGMYCAAAYDDELGKYVISGSRVGGIGSEMSHYKLIGQSRGFNNHFVESITLDPSAKIIEFNDIQHRYACELLKINHPEIINKIEQLDQIKNKIAKIPRNWDPLYESPPQELINLRKELRRIEKEIGYDAAISMTNRRIMESGYDVGVLAAEMGYDAINAVGHGQSGSYTVILNRTKIILCKGGSIYGN
jgi:hypothetical protein